MENLLEKESVKRVNEFLKKFNSSSNFEGIVARLPDLKFLIFLKCWVYP